jgi:hypothetical protein
MAGILDEVMEGISAKSGGTPPPATPPAGTPPAGTPPAGTPPATPPAGTPPTDKKGAFEYGSEFEEKYGERKT